ncbi:MAG: U32 family peptidase [Oligoflexia bacterium]|nr:U32 family peptidase [Oligoflexia bacterium]
MIKIVTYLSNHQDLLLMDSMETGNSIEVEVEVILSSKIFSLLSTLEIAELISLALECKKRKYISRLLLEIDILMTEDRLQLFKSEITSVETLFNTVFDAVRIKDLGALKFILERYPEIDVELILDNGPHNLQGIEAFVDQIGEKLKRVIVSAQLSKSSLIKYANKLKVPLEILVLGRILLFYTPRKLLSYVDMDKYAEATSEESFHKNFQIIESAHGTIMFYPKDLCLLSYIDYFYQSCGEKINFRFDLREGNKLVIFDDIFKYFKYISRESCENSKSDSSDLLEKIKNRYAQECKTLIRGHIEENKTDSIFKKLKNYHLQKSKVDCLYVGKVLEVEKGSYMVVMIENKNLVLKVGDMIKIINPLGKEILFNVNKIENIEDLQELQTTEDNDLILLPFCKGVSPGSLIYF